MSTNDLTLSNLKNLVDNSEQLSLLMLMLGDQNIDDSLFRAQVLPLLEKLNGDLQSISTLIMLQNRDDLAA